MIEQNKQPQIRELTSSEIDDVSGGPFLIPALIVANVVVWSANAYLYGKKRGYENNRYYD